MNLNVSRSQNVIFWSVKRMKYSNQKLNNSVHILNNFMKELTWLKINIKHKSLFAKALLDALRKEKRTIKGTLTTNCTNTTKVKKYQLEDLYDRNTLPKKRTLNNNVPKFLFTNIDRFYHLSTATSIGFTTYQQPMSSLLRRLRLAPANII